jgi:hypothetical protein
MILFVKTIPATNDYNRDRQVSCSINIHNEVYLSIGSHASSDLPGSGEVPYASITTVVAQCHSPASITRN